MTERDKIHIKSIKSELSFIKNALHEMDKENFIKHDIIQHAVCMSIITIGECANHLSEEFKEENIEIEWIQIIAVRNIATHGYWQLNMEQIWQAIIEDIPKLNIFFMNYRYYCKVGNLYRR